MKANGHRNLPREQARHPVLTESRSETRTASTIWTPEKFAAHLRGQPLVSSRGLVDWEGILVDRLYFPPQEINSPPSTHHALVLTLGSPYNYSCKIGKDIQECLLVSGIMNVVPAGQSRISRWDRPADVLAINLSPELLERTAQLLLANPDHIEFIDTFSFHDTQMEYLCRALLAELQQGASGGRLFGESLATALAVHLLRHYMAFPATISDIAHKLTRTEMRRAREYIHDNLGNDLSLREIADVSGVSANYLTALFKQTTGYSLHQYVIQQRVEKAKSLLQRSDLSIGEIAQRVGFYDSSHLTRHFKRLIGVTPRAMRQRS